MTFYTSFRAKWRANAGAVAAVRRDAGLTAALRLGVRLGISFARNQVSYGRDRLYDLRTGVDTVHDRGIGPEYPAGVTYLDGEYYERVTRSDFKRVMREAHVAPSDVTFIDLGCGKGAALLLAKEAGFKSLIGVEFNERLAAIAVNNTAKVKSPRGDSVDVTIITGDACDFAFPETPSLIFMYNPFGRTTMDVVLGHLAESLRGHPRELVVVYVNPVHAAAMDDWPVLERAASEPEERTLRRRLGRLGRRYGGISWVVYRARTSR